jgi:glycosyltransferase involved in cell wall biosynthesis
MIDIQKLFPFIEIIHHPITKDFKYEMDQSNKLLYKFSRRRWYSFLKMQKRVAPKINNIITPSINSLRDISKDFNCDPSRITVIQNGLDIDIFRPYNEISRNPLRLITTASADVPLKGLDYTLKSLAELKKDFDGIHLIVIGKLKEEGHTARLIKKLNIQDEVTFKTNLTKDEIAKEYAKSSISLVSSLYEGFGYPVIEAMSCGVPLIAANTSSIPELVDEFAILIPSQDSKTQIDSIKSVIQNYGHYKDIAEKGREHIINTFNWLKITEEYEKTIFKTIEDFKNANI